MTWTSCNRPLVASTISRSTDSLDGASRRGRRRRQHDPRARPGPYSCLRPVPRTSAEHSGASSKSSRRISAGPPRIVADHAHGDRTPSPRLTLRTSARWPAGTSVVSFRDAMSFARLLCRCSLAVLIFITATAHGTEPAMPQVTPEDTLVYVGTYTGGERRARASTSSGSRRKDLEVSQNITLVPLGAGGGDARARRSSSSTRSAGCSSPSTKSSAGHASARSRSIRHGKLTLINQQSSEGRGAVPSRARQGRAGTCWWPTTAAAASRCFPSRRTGQLGEASDVDAARGQERQSRAAEGPARALRDDVAGQQVRLRLRPGPRQGDDLPLRRERREAHAERAGIRRTQARRRPAAHGVPPGRQVRLRAQRAELDGHDLRLRREDRRADGSADGVDAARLLRRPQHRRGDRRASVGQVPLRLEPRPRERRALQRSTRRRARSRASRSRTPAARRRGTSASSRRPSTWRSPTRIPTRCWRRASTRTTGG